MLQAACLLPLLALVPGVDEFDGLVDHWAKQLEACAVPGLAVVVVANDEIALEATFGQRDATGRPVTPDTVFYIASVTKTFTATAIAKLADEGRVDLDASFASQLPRARLASPDATASVSVRDLLSHRKGLTAHPAIVFNDAYSGQITEDRFYRLLEHSQPTDAFAYNNLHFVLLGRVVEEASGLHWKEYLKTHLFDPAGMDRTSGNTSRYAAEKDVARGLTWDGFRWVDIELFKDDASMHAAGGLCTTARDLAQWIRLHLGDGELDGEPMLASSAAVEMRDPQVTIDGGSGRMARKACGFGWMLCDFEGETVFEHGGGYVGFATHVSFMPEYGVGVAVLSNCSGPGAGAAQAVALDVYDRLLGVETTSNWSEVRRRGPRWKDAEAADHARRAEQHGVQLSLAPEHYCGSYEHPDWGRFDLTSTPLGLQARIGNLRPPMLEGAAPDRFSTELFPGSSVDGAFVLKDGIAQAMIIHRGDDTLRFDRVR